MRCTVCHHCNLSGGFTSALTAIQCANRVHPEWIGTDPTTSAIIPVMQIAPSISRRLLVVQEFCWA